MVFYLSNLFVVVITTYLARKSQSQIASRILLGIAFLSMICVAGLRDKYVGTDTSSYVIDFQAITNYAKVLELQNAMGEYGYWMLNFLLHFIADEYIVLLFATALIVVGCYQFVIVKYSVSWEVSFFVYIVTGSYFFFFNGARQGIACAIYSLAVGPMLNKNLKTYVGIVLLAFLFHKTAIIMLPVYFFFNRPSTLKNNLLIIITGFLGIMLINNGMSVISKLDARYASYGTSGAGGGYVMLAINLVIGAFFLIIRKSIYTHRYEFDRFTNLVLISMMIELTSAILSLDPSGLRRNAVYFDIAPILMWPIVFENLHKRLSKFIIGYIFVICYLILFVLTTMSFSNMIPYVFNPLLRSF